MWNDFRFVCLLLGIAVSCCSLSGVDQHRKRYTLGYAHNASSMRNHRKYTEIAKASPLSMSRRRMKKSLISSNLSTIQSSSNVGMYVPPRCISIINKFGNKQQVIIIGRIMALLCNMKSFNQALLMLPLLNDRAVTFCNLSIDKQNWIANSIKRCASRVEYQAGALLIALHLHSQCRCENYGYVLKRMAPLFIKAGNTTRLFNILPNCKKGNVVRDIMTSISDLSHRKSYHKMRRMLSPRLVSIFFNNNRVLSYASQIEILAHIYSCIASSAISEKCVQIACNVLNHPDDHLDELHIELKKKILKKMQIDFTQSMTLTRSTTMTICRLCSSLESQSYARRSITTHNPFTILYEDENVFLHV